MDTATITAIARRVREFYRPENHSCLEEAADEAAADLGIHGFVDHEAVSAELARIGAGPWSRHV